MAADPPASPSTTAGPIEVPFAAVAGWAEDDHAAALAAFRLSLPAVAATFPDSLVARLAAVPAADGAAARTFFEQNFVASRRPGEAAGFLTAYYEPVVAAAHIRSSAFPVPLHRRPADLANLVGEADRAAPPGGLTHARRTAEGLVPYPTRREIDAGALDGQGLELAYVADAVERFFLQVQGSGVLVWPDGTQTRVTYDGKNGHPYTSLGRVLVDSGAATSAEMSLEFLARWLRADAARGRAMMARNDSYVFFKAVPGASAPRGVLDVPLTPLRSLAVDPVYTALGLPVFVDAPAITHLTGVPFRRLCIAQDVGSAIKGAERGDIFVGTGPEAGRLAGITKHAGRFVVLKPVGAP